MDSLLNEFISGFLFAYLMIFVRFGTAMIIMPGIGDTFVSAQIRLYFALALSMVVAPMLTAQITAPPSSIFMFMMMIINEAVIGIFIGMVSRILISVLAVAGMVISMQSGLASAQVFNPTFSGQGSIVGAFFSIVGVVLIFATNLHHLLILSVFQSYELFPFATMPETGDLAQLITRFVADSFTVGVQFAAPFIIVSLLMYLAIGVMARLMPQLQIFFIALPLQILISIAMLGMVLTTGMLYWLGFFENSLIGFLSN